MNKDEFWKVLDLLDWKSTGDDDKVLAPAVKYLSKKSVEDIYEFEELLAESLFAIDGIEFAENIGENSYDGQKNYFSADIFLYARCVALVNGREYYEYVLHNPQEMIKDMEFEALLTLAPEAYKLKEGKEFDYSPKKSYETFSNKKLWNKKTSTPSPKIRGLAKR